MSQSIQLQVTQVGLEQSIAAAMKRAGNSSQINLGTNSRQINALSQPLGRITGQADEFSKSMAAANARVLAFGASAGIIAGVSSAMAGLLQSTIKVEKSLVEIGSVLNKSGGELDKFGQGIFNVAKNTGKSFDEVATGALELARQGLSAEDTLNRLNDALILSRLSGLDAKQSVEGLTAAFNSFKSTGITTSEILNKVVAVSQKFAVSERDIIEGLGRSASVADLAGVSFEELSAIITAVQEKTARGGAVIGNSFKTIFARIQDKAVLSDLDLMGIAVTDLQGNVLPALKILENLAGQMGEFSQIEQADISKKLGGIYQLDKLLAALKDLSSESSVYRKALAEQEKAGISAYQKNEVLNTTLAALINKVAVSAEQLGAKLGEIGVTDSLKNVLGFFNSLLEGIQKILGQESGLGSLVKGLVKGLGNFLAGPGLAIFGAIILKLSKDLIQFGFASLKAFFGIGKAAKEVQNVESAISQILARNVNLQQQLFALEGNRAGQLRVITTALVEQEALLRRSAAISSGLAAPLYGAGVRAKDSGLRVGNSAGGYMPAVAKESKAIKQGVGGARSGDKPVVMPNFNFGGGKKGTMVAHSGEYVVPNFNGSGGSAVFNRQMVRSMGLPSGARKIGAAGGFVPNFAEEAKQRAAKTLGTAEVLESIGFQGNESYPEIFKKIEETYNGYTANWSVDKRSGKISNSSFQILDAGGRSLTKSALTTAEVNKKIASKKIEKSKEIYDANVGFNKAVMLIPQAQKYNASEANMAFDVPRKIGSKEYAAFRGGIAGVDKNLSDVEGKNLSRISDIDNSLRKALSGAAFSIIKKIQPGIKLDDTSDLSSKNIENLLEKGGAGAFGSIKGALFEAIISKVAKAKGKNFEEQGSLDVDFDAGGADSRKTLETIFGLTANTFDFADFKNSKKSKDKYVQQVMNYLPKDKDISKTSSAAGGYIPNFVSKSREMGSGAAGTFFRLGKNKEGTNVGVKKFKNYIPSRSIEAEWLTSEFVNKYANIPGVFGPKNLSSFEDSKRKRAIRKEVVSDPLARTAVGSQKASDFGQKVLFQAFKARGLQIGDFHGSNYTLNKSAQDAINGMQSFPSDPVGAFSALRQIAATGGRIGAIDVGAANVTDPARSIIGKIMERQVSQKTAAGGYIPNFANPLTDAFGGLKFAASAANTFRKTLPKGSVKKAIKEKNFDPIFNSLLRFFSNPSRLIKSSGDLDSAKKAIKLALNNDIIREAFAKRVAPLISSQNYNTNTVFQKDRRSPDDFERKVENYTKYKLFGGTKDLNQYAPEGIKGLTQKGKYLKINDPKVQAELSANAMGRSGFRNEYRRLDDKGNYFASNYLLGGYTGRARMFKNKAYASYKDRWDVNLNRNEKEFLKERLNKGRFDNYFEDFDDEDASKSEKLDSELGANTYGAADLDSFILRELVSAIPKAKPAIFKGVVPISIGGLASGYIPNFAQGAPNRGGKFTAVQIAKGLGKAAIKVLIDQYLGDGVLDSVESAGLTKMKPSDFKFFTEELKKPIKGKHRRAFERALKDPATRAQFERMRSGGTSAAGGFLPNFANPLQDAVGREMAAGVPASQIYIDKNSSLKNAMNPMGLMVANRRDEPAGGFQGINRARREGANPMMYGAAGGFVPNYAAEDNSDGSNKLLASLFIFQTAVSVASGFLDQAGDSGKKLSEALQKLATTALIFGGIAFSGPIKRLKQFSDEVFEITRTVKNSKVGLRGGFSQGFRSGLAGKRSEFFTPRGIDPALADRYNRRLSNRYNLSGVGLGAGRVGAVAGGLTRGAGALLGSVAGPVTLAIGAFKGLSEALSSLTTYSNQSAKTVAKMSVYAAKAAESLSELDRASIEAETNRTYGASGSTFLGGVQDFSGGTAFLSAAFKEKMDNINYKGENLLLNNVSEEQFKAAEKAYISAYVGENRTKFETSEQAIKAASESFLTKGVKDYGIADLRNATESIRKMSIGAEKMRKENAIAEAMARAALEAEKAEKNTENFKLVLGDLDKKVIALKANIFSLQTQNDIFKAIAESAIDGAYNLSEFDKATQKLEISLGALRSSSAIKELDLYAKKREEIANIVKENITDQNDIQEFGLSGILSEIQDKIVRGEEINVEKYDPEKLFRLFGDYRKVLKEQAKDFKAQTVELQNQETEARNNLRIEALKTAEAQQYSLALESQNKKLEIQGSNAEKVFEYMEKIRNSTNKINDLNFERGLIGATQRERLSAQIGREPELKTRAKEEVLRNFQQDRIGSVKSLESLIPSTLSAELQLSLKSGILAATENIRKQNTLEDVSTTAATTYNDIINRINNAVIKESNERKSFIDQIKKTLTNSTATFESSVISAANKFKEIIISAALLPEKEKRDELLSQKEGQTSELNSQMEKAKREVEERFISYTQEQLKLEGGPPNIKTPSEFSNSDNKFNEAKERFSEAAKKIEILSNEINSLNEKIKSKEAEVPNEETITQKQAEQGIVGSMIAMARSFFSRRTGPMSPQLVNFPQELTGSEEALEAAQKEREAALLEISNSTANAADELEKLTSVSRILGDEFKQLQEGIPAAIAGILSQRNKSISGAEILGANYDLETQRQLAGKTEEEANKIIRDRQNKGIGQLFAEEYGKTPEEQALDLSKTIVDGSVQFKNNMIEAIMGAAEGTSSLKDGLRSAAYEFVKTINQRMMSQLIDRIVGGSVQSGTGQTGGGFIQGVGNFLSGMFSSSAPVTAAAGGMINGGSGMKDDVPAMLMGGEYVVNKKAVSKYGAQFLESINNGTLTGYAKGGKVQAGPQGNFYTPGTFGQGAISGKRNLLDFATQTGTSGKFDQMINEIGFQSVSLEPESSRLSVSGMRNSPMFDATQSAKGQAFDLYLQQYNAEREAKKQAKAQKKALTQQLIMLAVSAAASSIGSVAMTGGTTAVKALGENAKFLDQVSAFAGGVFKGGNIVGTGQMAGGLNNLFSGNFATAFRSGIPLNAGAVGGPYGNIATGVVGQGGYDPSGPDGRAISDNVLPIGGPIDINEYSKKTAGFSFSPFSPFKILSRLFSKSRTGAGTNLGATGPFDKNGNYVLDWANDPKKQQIPQTGFAIGGMIPSTSGIDTIPAMLSGGEFVMNRSAVQGIGAQNLQSMNSGGTSITSEETSKELNEKLLAKLDELISSSGSAGNITINVAPSGQTTQETSQDPSAGRQQLARQIKDAVLQIINDEKRIGGSLRR